MIPDQHDPNEPRYLQLRITDRGDHWDVEIDRNRIDAADEDVCLLLGELNLVLDQMHAEAHVARGLLESRN